MRESLLNRRLALNQKFIEEDVFDDARLHTLIQRDGDSVFEGEFSLYGLEIVEGLRVEITDDFVAGARRVAHDLLKTVFVEHLERHLDTDEPARLSREVHGER